MNRLALAVLDLRSLQDPNYRDRGVGRLGSNLVRAVRGTPSASGARVVGLIDPHLPALDQHVQEVVDELRPHGYLPEFGASTWFVQLSPMTHDPLFIARILECPRTFKASVVHDFIPLRYSAQYLPSAAQRIDYYTKLRWLRRYDHFFPNSAYTKSEITKVLGAPPERATISPAPLDPVFLKASSLAAGSFSGHVLVAGGGDPRKNVECAIRAHALSPAAQRARVPLLVAGGTPDSSQLDAAVLYYREGGNPELLKFLPRVSDEELAVLYRDAACVVVPSKDEGFSIPVIEGMCAGTPVLASRIPAHHELIEKDEFMFDPAEPNELAGLVDRVLSEPGFRNGIVQDQGRRWQRFRGDDIARRFWARMEEQASARIAAPLVGGRRPRVAFLGPLPPDRSGVADYTAATFKEFGKLADIHAFTPTEKAPVPEGAASVGPISALPYLTGEFDRVVGVMGNSHFHTAVYELLMRRGGACIEHDNRLLGFYCFHVSRGRARELAEAELDRQLAPGELDSWLADEANLKATLLGELALACQPMFVHSRGTARILRERIGVESQYLPFSIYREWTADELTPRAKDLARIRLGISRDEIAIVSAGYVAAAKAPLDCIWALDMLRGWGVRAKLYFIGDMATDRMPLLQLCEELGLLRFVRFMPGYVSEEQYRDYLKAADVGLQLRTHLLGGLSGALLDCIAIGLPTVANEDLCASMEAPGYIFPVPDRPSPVLIAEALVAAVESRGASREREAERKLYCEQHSFRSYARRLYSGLALDDMRSQAA